MFEAVQKFGLAYSDFPTMLSNIAFFLRALSLNVDPRNQTRIPIINTIVDVVFGTGYLYVFGCLCTMVWFVLWKCTETGDVVTALIVFSLGASSQMGPYKIIFMFIHKGKLQQLVTECLASNALAESESRLSTNLEKSLRIVKRRGIFFWSFIMFNGLIHILKPVFLPGRHMMENFFIFWGLEPMLETPNYQIAFTLAAMGDCVSVYLPSTATTFQIVIVGYIEAQMLAWSEELAHLWEDALNQAKHINIPSHDSDAFTKERDNITNEFVSKRLKDILKAHTTNLSLLDQMEYVFRGTLFLEFALLMVCLIAELLGGLQNTYMQVPFALMQVGMDCFIGQKLLDASVVFERAVYFCKWGNFNKDNMKTVLTMLIMSQRTMTLTAGGITMLNYMSFLAIIKMIYSTYTTLNATMN